MKGWRYDDFGMADWIFLMHVTRNGRLNVLKWLLQELRMDVKEQNNVGFTALHVAAVSNEMESARLLVEGSAQLIKDKLTNSTPLDWAKKRYLKKWKNC